MNTQRVSSSRLRVCAAIAWLALPLAPSQLQGAQPVAVPRAVEGTVGDLIRSARASARVARFADTMPLQYERLQRQLDALARTALDTLPIDAVARASMASRESGRASFLRVARWSSRSAVAVLAPSEGAALDSLARISLQFLPELLEQRVSADSTDALLAPISAFNRARLTESLAQKSREAAPLRTEVRSTVTEAERGGGRPQLRGPVATTVPTQRRRMAKRVRGDRLVCADVSHRT